MYPFFLRKGYYLQLAGHQGDSIVRSCMTKEIQGIHEVSEVYTKVRECHSCMYSYTHARKGRNFKQYFLDRTYVCVGTDILETLPLSKQGNQLVIIIMDEYTKLTK